jgi:arylsulfatase A-like enzyme
LSLVLFGTLIACSPDNTVTNENGASDATATGGTAAGNATATDTPPNILFIVADDIGFTDLGAFGGEISTPNLDRLAHGGLRLNNLHAAPACRNTRLMLMSSAGTVAANQLMPEAGRGGVLSLNYATIPELLHDAGYATYGAGKWDLGNVEGFTPADRGFDRSWMQLGGSSSYFAEYLTGDTLGFEDDGRPVGLAELPDDFYVTEHYTDRILEYLQSTEQGTPWFAYMPYTAPHWPLMLPDDWLDRYAGRYDDGYDALRARRFQQAASAGVLPPGSNLYGFEPLTEPWTNLSADEQRRYSRAQEIFAGMVEYLDMSIGRVINYLEKSGQLDNTVIVFTADHGASAGEHGVDTGRVPRGGGPTIPDHIDNSFENFGRPGSFIDHGRGFGEAATAPFKYQKGSLDEGGLRAAAFVYYPSAVEAGRVSNTFMTMMDFLPTFLEIAGTEHPGAGPYRDGRQINDIVGRSAWPHLTGQASIIHLPWESAGWAGGDGGALIRGDYKIINRPPPGSRGSTPWRLYDLASDPGERRDIASENTALTAELVAEWAENWR